MKIIKIYFLLFFLCAKLIFAQSWFDLKSPQIINDGSGYSTFDQSIAVATDQNGNSYYTGYYDGVLIFGNDTLVSNGNRDIFVAKKNSMGEWIWANSAGGSNSDYSRDIIVTEDNDIYIVGYVYNQVKFGNIILNCQNNSELFVAKLDSNGNWLWASIATQGGFDRANSIVYKNGYCYITGNFEETVNFGTITLTSNGSRDIFVAKIDKDGNWIWAVKGGSSSSDDSYSIALNNNNIVIGGYFSDNASFGSINLSSAGGRDALVAALDTNGNWLFAKRAGSNISDEISSLCVSTNGNIYVAGYYSKSFSIDTFNLTNTTNRDLWFAKLSSNGNWIWVKTANGSGNDNVYKIFAKNNKIYVSGGFETELYFGTINLTGSSIRRSFYAILDENGNYQYANSLNGNSTNDCYSICIDNNNRIYLTGQFFDKIILNSIEFISKGDSDFYSITLDSNYNYIDYDVFGAFRGIVCHNDSEIDKNGNLIIAGYFYGKVVFGNDTIVSNGLKDAFISSYSLLNGFNWVRRFGSNKNEEINALAIDSTGNIIIGGYFEGNINELNFSKNIIGPKDIFYARVSTNNGNILWFKSLGNDKYNSINTIAVRNNGRIFYGANFQGTLTINSNNIVSNGFDDILIFSSDTNGVILNTLKAGGADFDDVKKIVASPDGSIYVTGSFEGNASFGSTLLASSGGDDVFIARINTSVNWHWAKSLGTSYFLEYGNSLTTDNSGNIYLAATYRDLLEYQGNFLIPYGENDILLAKFLSNGNLSWIKYFGSSGVDLPNSLMFKNNKIYLTGVYSNVISNFGLNLNPSGIINTFVIEYDLNGNINSYFDDKGNNISKNSKYHIINNNLRYLVGNFVGNIKFSNLNLTEKYSLNENIYIAHYGIEPIQRKWNFTANPNSNSKIIIPKNIQPTINNRPIKNGDAIGVFYIRNSNYYPAGYSIYNGEDLIINVSGDNENTLVKDGMANNEPYNFIAWDSDTGIEYVTEVRYSYGTGKFSNGDTSIVSKFPFVYDTLNINLQFGWNLISINLQPISNSLENIFSNIFNDISIVKNSKGQVFIPNYMINTIGFWNLNEAYLVYANKSTVLKVIGEYVKPEEKIIRLNNGWNYVSYLRKNQLNAELALANIANKGRLVIVKNLAGQVFIPSFNINTIGNMKPSVGYQMYLNSTDTLIYPSNEFSGKQISFNPNINFLETEYFPQLNYTTPNNMTIIVNAPLLEDKSEIAFYNKFGNLCGTSKFYDGISVVTIWGNDEIANINNLLDEEEEISASIYCSKIKIEIKDFKMSFKTINNKNIENFNFKSNQILIAELFNLDNNYNEVTIFPIPAINKLYIDNKNIPNEQIKYKITDLLGNLVIEGNGKEIDISKLLNGTYNIIIDVDGNFYFKKFVKINE
jgi:hypothetical protein